MSLLVEIERLMPAPRRDVFAAFTDARALARWWGPEGFTIPSADFDPREGRRYRIAMQPPDGERFHLTGEFRDVSPPAVLVFTFAWEEPDPDDVETVARLSFREAGESTEVALVQGRFRTEARRALHHTGWGESLDKLARLLTKQG